MLEGFATRGVGRRLAGASAAVVVMTAGAIALDAAPAGAAFTPAPRVDLSRETQHVRSIRCR